MLLVAMGAAGKYHLHYFSFYFNVTVIHIKGATSATTICSPSGHPWSVDAKASAVSVVSASRRSTLPAKAVSAMAFPSSSAVNDLVAACPSSKIDARSASRTILTRRGGRNDVASRTPLGRGRANIVRRRRRPQQRPPPSQHPCSSTICESVAPFNRNYPRPRKCPSRIRCLRRCRRIWAPCQSITRNWH